MCIIHFLDEQNRGETFTSFLRNLSNLLIGFRCSLIRRLDWMDGGFEPRIDDMIYRWDPFILFFWIEFFYVVYRLKFRLEVVIE